MERWPLQVRGVAGVLAAQQKGQRRVCLTAPTGTGKTLMAGDLIKQWIAEGHKVAIYTNRRLLVDQLSNVLEDQGIWHGVRAAGHPESPFWDVQVCSIQTEHARKGATIYTRLVKKGVPESVARERADAEGWQPFDATRVLVDECHLQKGKTAQEALQHHLEAGAFYVGLSATPINVGHLYDHLVVAGNNTDGRECGALVLAHHYGPDEPSLKHIGKVELGEDLTENQNRKAMGAVERYTGQPNEKLTKLFGRVFEWWQKLNPQGLPTILFAPGVCESVWFAQQFLKHGIPAAHIDGQEVWTKDGFERTNREARRQILEGSEDGTFTVLTSRFVLREGIDAPWIAHGVFATVFGACESYLQSGGRLLRRAPGKSHAVVQDHGGNWHRHGSLNADRVWRLDWNSKVLAGLRENRLQQKDEPEPFLCPQCRRVLMGRRCPCGYLVEVGVKSRPVVMEDGSLVELRGDIYQPKKVSAAKDGPKKWKDMYWRARNGGLTFRQAEALFASENGWEYPDKRWPLMPTRELDWFRLVSEVDIKELTKNKE